MFLESILISTTVTNSKQDENGMEEQIITKKKGWLKGGEQKLQIKG